VQTEFGETRFFQEIPVLIPKKFRRKTGKTVKKQTQSCEE